MSRNTNKYKDTSSVTLRIRNTDTLKLINELAEKRGNRNAVLNEILDIGAPTLYAQENGNEVKTAQSTGNEKAQYSPNTAREIKELRKVIDDVFIQMLSVETMVAGLFNVKTDELDGDEVNAESLRDGSLCELPEFVAGLKADLTRSDK